MLTDLPNVLTLLRIAAIPLLIALISWGGPSTNGAALIVYIAACLTDYLDGMLARRWRQNSELGRMLDPIADKLLVGALLLTLAGCGRLLYGSLYAAVIILMREILISGMREYMASCHASLPSTRLAKWKTFMQMVAIGFLLVDDNILYSLNVRPLYLPQIGAVLLWISVVPTLMSGWGYLSKTLSTMVCASGESDPSAKGARQN